MTTIEQAARAEAERRFPPARTPGGYRAPLTLQADEVFVGGASWLAEHLHSDEVVEWAAKAIHNSPPSSLACASSWDQHSDVTKEDYRRYARAALSAALGTNHENGRSE